MTRTLRGSQQRGVEGFTLVEALIAIVVLVFGLIAVAQLMLVSSSSNTIANRSTMAAATASEELERLMTVPYGNLPMGGDITADDCGGAAFGRVSDVPGTVQIRTCSQVGLAAGMPNLLFIAVRSQAVTPPFANMTRAEFTSFRAINGVAAPAAPPPAGP